VPQLFSLSFWGNHIYFKLVKDCVDFKIKYVLLFGLKWAMIKKIAEISGEIIIYAL